MNCKKCGKPLKEDRLFCENCGTEVQIVPEYSTIEDELTESIRFLKAESAKEAEVDSEKEINKQSVENQFKTKTLKTNKQTNTTVTHVTRNSILQDQLETEKKRIIKELDDERNLSEQQISEENITTPKKEDDDEWQEFRLDKDLHSPKKKRIRLIAAIIGLSLFILSVIVGIVVFFVMKGRNHSFDVQYEAASSYWKSGQYEDAMIAYEKAVHEAKTNKEKLAANKELSKLFIEKDDKNNAIYYLENAISAESFDVESIEILVGLYEEKNDADAIRKLAKKASSKETASLFEKYLLNQPIFNFKSGTYNEPLVINIESAADEKIYYTLDDTVPTEQSTLYKEPISIGEGTTIIHAITINDKGFISEEEVVNYSIQLDIPPKPIISPDSGKYSETGKISIMNIPTNCKVFYTIDGGVPSNKSLEYTEPFEMLLGNHVISVISINQFTGASSEVVSKVFQLDVSGKMIWTEATNKVLTTLLSREKVTDKLGTLPDGGICVPIVQTIKEIGKTKYYIVKCYRKKGEVMTEIDWYYAVNINTGDVYTAIPSGNDLYNLNP